jgi:hypothetical protein
MNTITVAPMQYLDKAMSKAAAGANRRQSPKVSQSLSRPPLTPRANHWTRCLELPCVKVCGMANPRACFCNRSVTPSHGKTSTCKPMIQVSRTTSR